jgi:hypothetical protein
MTPREVIILECQYCQNANRSGKCQSTFCFLNNATLTTLKRIKAHCLTCVPDQNREGVQACTGMVIGSRPRMCPLHPYRMGHNPNRAGLGFGRKGYTQGAVREVKRASNDLVAV